MQVSVSYGNLDVRFSVAQYGADALVYLADFLFCFIDFYCGDVSFAVGEVGPCSRVGRETSDEVV